MSESKTHESISRRRFIRKAATTAGIGVGAAALAMHAGEAKAETSQDNWLKQTEVLVIGTGVGGCVAALTAQEAGAKVLIVEKAPQHFFGGDSSIAGGLFCTKEPQDYYDTLMKYSDGRANKTTAKLLADNAVPAAQWMKANGIRLNSEKGGERGPKEGGGVMKDFKALIEKSGIEVLYDTKVTKLLTDDRMGVIGVQVLTSKGLAKIKALKAVILATGGYQGNEEMTVKYIGPQSTSIVVRGFPHVTGDGHRMALELDARLLNMGDCHGSPIQPKSNANFTHWYPFGIVVNKNCERFVDEADPPTNYTRLGKAIFRQPAGIAYGILDEKWRELVPPVYQTYFLGRGGKLTEANTIEELAEKLGLNPAALKNTVDEYNAAIADAKALSLTPPKTATAHKLENPKFYATPLVNGSALTFGGVEINKKAQVKNNEGKVIPHLYAVGEVVGGIYYDNYLGGSGLSSGSALGRVAGKEAASEKI